MKKENILKIAREAVSGVTALYHRVTETARDILSKATTKVSRVSAKATELSNSARKNATEFYSNFTSRVSNFPSKVKANATVSYCNARTAATELLDAVCTNATELYHRAIEKLSDVRDQIEDYSNYNRLKEKYMTSEERAIFITISFYAFTLLLIPFVLALPIMIFRGYTFMVITIELLVFGFALPSTIMVMFRKFFWVFFQKIDFFFQKYSLPIIGQGEGDKVLCTRQLKIFRLLRNMSIAIVSCYIAINIASANSAQFLKLFFNILLSIISWGSTAFMAANGIYLYTMCLVDLKRDIDKQGEPKRLRTFSIKAENIISFRKPKYVPKRLRAEDTSTRGKNFSLKKLAGELRASSLGTRVKSA